MEFFYFLWFIFSLMLGFRNMNKGHSFWSAFIISLLLTPIIGMLFVLSKPAKDKCKYCKGHIEYNATVCKHCGREQ